MAPAAKCHACGSEEIDYDPARGDAACVDCGAVVQQSLIVNEVTFQEDARGRSNLIGQHVRADGQTSFSVLPGQSRNATEHTMTHARRKMMPLASQLRLASRHTDQAIRLFRLAVERNFHKGRRVNNLVCACLYAVCRLKRTPHMLLDFADVTQTNLFTLGNTYLKLIALLSLNIPVIDPSLYMHRFAAHLEFGSEKNAVAMTALRIAARMQRDWMTHGRRPAGLCGAALLTASVMHNFYRSQSEIARVVRIGNNALRMRLQEFNQTNTATLTAAQIDAGGGDDGKLTSLIGTNDQLGKPCDPPAFQRLQQRKDEESKRKEAESAASGSPKGKPVSDAEKKKQAEKEERIRNLMEQAMNSEEMQALDTDPKDTNKEPSQDKGDEAWTVGDDEQELSELDEEDTAKYISTEEEAKAKEIVWTETNRDYLEKQARLELMKRERPEEYKRLRPGRSKKKRKADGGGGKGSGKSGGGSGEKTTEKPKPSKKLNYSVLQTLAEGDGMAPEEDMIS